MHDQKCSVLIVDDDPIILKTLSHLLQREFAVSSAENHDQALAHFEGHRVDIILCDQNMPGKSGVDVLEWVLTHHPRTIRILMTGFANLEAAIDAVNRGRIYRFILKPWQTKELLQAMRNAARQFTLESEHDQLVARLKQLNEQLEDLVDQRTRELKETNRQLRSKNSLLERLALTDELTGLPNRRAIEQILHAELRRRERYATPLAVGLIDADHFKEINTKYLYPGGDHVLVSLAKIINSSLRSVDSVGRMGGEEFLVVAPETGSDGATTLGERIRLAVESTRTKYKEQTIHVTVSVGFTSVDENSPVDAQDLIHRCSEALADAKSQGRNRIVNLPFSAVMAH